LAANRDSTKWKTETETKISIFRIVSRKFFLSVNLVEPFLRRFELLTLKVGFLLSMVIETCGFGEVVKGVVV